MSSEIRRESGVIVEERSWPEKSLVEFRGVTIIDASIKDPLQFFSMTNSRLSGWTGSPSFGWSKPISAVSACTIESKVRLPGE